MVLHQIQVLGANILNLLVKAVTLASMIAVQALGRMWGQCNILT